VNFWKAATLALALAACLILGAIVFVGANEALSPRAGESAAQATAPPPADALTPVSGRIDSGSRLVIPSIAVDAPVVVVGTLPNGEMATPSNGYDVGWSDFSTPPGQPGNTVMNGHVDYDIGPAVFYRLRELRPDDEVRVELSSGETVVYRVTQTESYPRQSAPLDEILAETEEDTITLITCDGAFDPSVRLYDHRLVVRGERVA
jgi:LPXTG-site transpeptidase (sortase) family protein